MRNVTPRCLANSSPGAGRLGGASLLAGRSVLSDSSSRLENPSAQSYALSGPVVQCANCRGPYRAVLARCCHCQAPNPAHAGEPEPVTTAAATAAKADVADMPAGNSWNPTLMQCGRAPEHKCDSRYQDHCLHCNPGTSGSGSLTRPSPVPGGGLPPALAARLGGILGPRR